MNPEVSVIIPIYNVELYLERCLRSVLSQTYNNFELILVDDGSTDCSGSICDRYALIDKRIKVIHQNNSGVCAARNKGLDNCSGDYVYFVDSDDVVEKDGLEVLMSYMSDTVDMVIGGYNVCSKEGDFVSRQVKTCEVKLSPSDAIFAMIEPKKMNVTLGMLWINLFRREIINNNNLRFDESLYLYEDNVFSIQYLCHCSKSVMYTSRPVYHYYNYRKDNTTNTIFSNYNSKALSALDARLQVYQLMKSAGQPSNNIKIARRAVFTCYKQLSSFLSKFGKKKELFTIRQKIFKFLTKKEYYFYKVREFCKFIYYTLFTK